MVCPPKSSHRLTSATQNATCHFNNNDTMSKNNYVMTNPLKPCRFM